MSELRVDTLSDVAETKNITVANITQVSDLTAGNIVLTPSGTITATDTQAGFNQVASQLAGKQPIDATLTALAGVTTSANTLIYATGADAFSTSSLTPFARTLLDDTDAAAARLTLGVGSLTMGTKVSVTGLAAGTFTGIPANAKKISISLYLVQQSSTSPIVIAFDSGTYRGSTSGITTAVVSTAWDSNGLRIQGRTTPAITDIYNGEIVMTLHDPDLNIWGITGSLGLSNAALTTVLGGNIQLATPLSFVRLGTVAGSGTFTFGNFNVIYEV